MESYSHLFVCLLGMGTVFLGLICLVLLTGLMTALLEKKAPASATTVPDAGSAELLLAISAALAVESGAEISDIRIRSIKKLGTIMS